MKKTKLLALIIPVFMILSTQALSEEGQEQSDLSLPISTETTEMRENSQAVFTQGDFIYSTPQAWPFELSEDGSMVHYGSIFKLPISINVHTNVGYIQDGFLELVNQEYATESFIAELAAMADKWVELPFILDNIPSKAYCFSYNVDETIVDIYGLIAFSKNCAFILSFTNFGDKENAYDQFIELVSTIQYKNQEIAEQMATPTPEPTSTPFPITEYGEFNFKKVARNPENFVGEKVRIEGHVVQVVGTRPTGYTIRLATNGRYDDIVYLTVPSWKTPDYNILDDDNLIVYVTLEGEHTYQSTLGGAITLPAAEADRVELSEE